MEIKNIKQSIEKTKVIDTATGEIIEEYSESQYKEIVAHSKDEFAFIYASLNPVLSKLSKPAILTYLQLIQRVSINTNELMLVKPTIETIAKAMNVGSQYIRNAMVVLKKKDILISKGSGLYVLNPLHSWRGNTDERVTSMRLVLELKLTNKLKK